MASNKDAGNDMEEMEETENESQETDKSWDTSTRCIQSRQYEVQISESCKSANCEESIIQQKTRKLGISIDIESLRV